MVKAEERKRKLPGPPWCTSEKSKSEAGERLPGQSLPIPPPPSPSAIGSGRLAVPAEFYEATLPDLNNFGVSDPDSRPNRILEARHEFSSFIFAQTLSF